MIVLLTQEINHSIKWLSQITQQLTHDLSSFASQTVPFVSPPSSHFDAFVFRLVSSSFAFTYWRPFTFLLLHPTDRPVHQYSSPGSKKKKKRERSRDRRREGRSRWAFRLFLRWQRQQWSHWQQRCTRRSAHAGMRDIVMVQSDRNGSRRVTSRPPERFDSQLIFLDEKCGAKVTESGNKVSILCHCTRAVQWHSIETTMLENFCFWQLFAFTPYICAQISIRARYFCV